MMVTLAGGHLDGRAMAVVNVPGRPPPGLLYATQPGSDIEMIGNRALPGYDMTVVYVRRADTLTYDYRSG